MSRAVSRIQDRIGGSGAGSDRRRSRKPWERSFWQFHGEHGQDDSVTNALAEEARKEGLRRKISSIFGEDVAAGESRIREDDSGQGGDQTIVMRHDALSGEPARQQFAGEERDLSGALQSHYTTDLSKKYGDAERALRFGAANTGNVGSQTYADEQARINEENRMGGTSTAEAVRRALQGLRTSREDVRGRAMNLVSAGMGEEGVRSATEGLRAASETARTANKERLFDELFQNLAYTRVNQNEQTRANQGRNYLGSFFQTRGSSGRVYP